jgi:hypothetical protein
MDVVVAIDVPPPQERLLGALVLPSTLHYAGTPEKFQQPGWGGGSPEVTPIDTSFTGRIHPAAVGKFTIRLRTSSKLMGIVLD